MTSISSLSNWQPVAPRLPFGAPAKAGAPADAAASSASSIVKLSPAGLAAAKAEEAEQLPLVLPASVRFKGLGAAMLDQFKSGGAVPVGKPAELPDELDNKFTLSITTRSGVQVELALASLDDGMAIQVSASEALSDAERGALAGLAAGFQAAIDGMLQDEPQVRLGGLAQFDTAVLKSVNLQVAVKRGGEAEAPSTLAFHADGAQRKVSIGGASGAAEVSIDTSKLNSLGNKEQQAKAINSYLKQFDQAAARGHGDAGLMTMFKDAFADLSRTSRTEAPADTGLTLPGRWKLAAEDHAALTGLADFSASVTQTPKWSNPLRLAEKDSFTYEVSQSTSTEGPRRDDMSISQKQQSSMTAQFHEPSKPGGELKLDLTSESQNYNYHQIHDTASSDVELGYKEGRLVKATLRQSASQSEHIMSYVRGKLTSDKTIPAEHTLLRDLLPALSAYQSGDPSRRTSEERDERHRLSLVAVNDGILLLASPSELALRK
jgi:hypothetical protein